MQRTFLLNGVEVSTHFGARLVAEGDLMVRVGSESINEAATDLELLAGLDAVMPYLELPDLLCATNIDVTAQILTAINAGARAGIAGKPIPLEANAEWLKRLAGFTVDIRDASNNNVLGNGRGHDLLGHPINVVRWIRDELKAHGGMLRRGDLLSLGTLAPMIPAKAGLELQATYRGLSPDGAVVLKVTFREQAPPPPLAVPPVGDVTTPGAGPL